MTEPTSALQRSTLVILEELQGPSKETKAQRRVLIAKDDEARLIKENEQ